MGMDRATCKYWNDWVPPLGCCQTAFRPEMELLVISSKAVGVRLARRGRARQGTRFAGGRGASPQLPTLLAARRTVDSAWAR